MEQSKQGPGVLCCLCHVSVGVPISVIVVLIMYVYPELMNWDDWSDGLVVGEMVGLKFLS